MLTLTYADIPRGTPKWQATILVDDDGRAYVPAMLWPSGELLGVAASSQDGEKSIICRNHPFVPLDWIMRECPEDMETWSSIKAMVDRDAAEHPAHA